MGELLLEMLCKMLNQRETACKDSIERSFALRIRLWISTLRPWWTSYRKATVVSVGMLTYPIFGYFWMLGFDQSPHDFFIFLQVLNCGWWFWTFLVFPCIRNGWLTNILRVVETTNQIIHLQLCCYLDAAGICEWWALLRLHFYTHPDRLKTHALQVSYKYSKGRLWFNSESKWFLNITSNIWKHWRSLKYVLFYIFLFNQEIKKYKESRTSLLERAFGMPLLSHPEGWQDQQPIASAMLRLELNTTGCWQSICNWFGPFWCPRYPVLRSACTDAQPHSQTKTSAPTAGGDGGIIGVSLLIYIDVLSNCRQVRF